MAASPIHPDVELWRQRVQEWYPDLFAQTYFLPPVHMNITGYEEVELRSGHTVQVTLPPGGRDVQRRGTFLHESDVRDDRAQLRVLKCLHQLAEEKKEVMFVLSQQRFEQYLNEPAFHAAASRLPKPCDLKEQNQHQGEFDILIIHRRYGILVSEIRIIGATLTEQHDKRLKQIVEQAINQLHKCLTVLRHLLSDNEQQPRILSTLMLPYITSAQMQRVVADDPRLRQELCQCLQVDCSVDPVPFCLTSDDLATPSQWWKRRMADAGADPAMSDDAYLNMIARFGGPASRITVFGSQTPRVSQTPRRPRYHYIRMNTTGEAVVETANRFTPAHVVLHPLHVEILNLDMPLLFLTGPPGTGICIMLVLKGLEWLRQGNQVHVISTWYGSEASSHLIVSQMKQMAGPAAVHLIHLHSLDLDQDNLAASEALVRTLADKAVKGQLFLVANEVFNEATVDRPFTDFCDDLLSRVPELHLWSASQYSDYGPPMLTQKVLTEPLRIPPSVTRQLQQCGYTRQDREILGYTEPLGPLPSDGLAPIELVHAGDGHRAFEAPDCFQCGQEVGRTLTRLHIGEPSRGGNSPENPRYRDVLILSRGNLLHDATTDAAGNVTHPASGFIQGLRASGIPVTVLARGDAAGLRDLATMAGPDHAVAAFCGDVKDLERKIVVWVQSSEFRQDEDEGRRQACGCCSAQLVFVRPPPDQEYPSSDDDADDGEQ